MAFKVKIDNVEYDLKDNFTVKDELNETLDSAIIQFNTYGQEVNFESFDVAQIYDSNDKITKKYFLVDSYDDEIHSFGDTLNDSDHLYTVTLFSETKELERITLPNCSVTQPITEGSSRKTVWDEIVRVCSLYVPRIKVYDANATNQYRYARKYGLDPLLQTRFRNIECPEFQWNNPTLREVLNDLVSTDDCIITAKRGVISFYDLHQRGNPIDVSKLNFSKKTMASSDYVGELTIDMQNAIGKSGSLICENVTLRAPEGSGTLTTENGVLKTLNPIYAIKRLRVKCPFIIYVQPSDSQQNPVPVQHYAWVDITDRVIEKEKFDLMSNVKLNSSAYNGLPTFTDQNGARLAEHKSSYFYFKRGGTNIFNIGTMYPIQGGGNAPAAKVLLGQVCFTLYGGSFGLGTEQNPDPRNLQFYLEYETVAEHSLKVGKNLPVKHPENRIFDNQSNSYVDQEHQSIFEYAKINRLGHKLRTIRGDYYQESEVPQLGDYIGDEILFSREITYQDNIIKFKGMLTPNYVLKDFFTGVKAKKRSWQIAKNEDALTRHDVYKLYIETSFYQKADKRVYFDANDVISRVESRSFITYFIPFERLAEVVNDVPRYTLSCAVMTSGNNEDFPANLKSVALDTELGILGRSICLDFGFNDNYKSADYIVFDGTETTQKFYPYANENGEYNTENLTVYLAERKVGSDASATQLSKENLLSQVREGYKLPEVTTSDLITYKDGISLNLNVQKDNREIIRHTLQFEFCSDTDDIIVTDEFLKRICFFTKQGYTSTDYYVYFSDQKYQKNATTPLGYPQPMFRVKKTVNTSALDSVKLTVVINDAPVLVGGIKSWAVVGTNRKLLLAVNVPSGATRMECYFNMLRSRDDKIYTDTYNGIIVGDLAGRTYETPTQTASPTIQVQRRTITRSQVISGSDEEENENE